MAWRQRSRNEWRQLVVGWERSSLTQEGYCLRHGISVASLHRWRRIFAEDAARRAGAPAPVSEFVPVTLVGAAPARSGAELTLVLADGLRLEVGAQCPAETLKRVLDVLQERA